MKKLHFTFFVIVLSSYISMAQDLIIRNDRVKIECRIIKEDSTMIRYRESSNKRQPVQTIAKSDVLKYYNSSSAFTYQRGNPATIPDPAGYTNYKTIVLIRGDTIHQAKSGEYEFRHAALSSHDVLDLTSSDPLAFQEMKKASSAQRSCRVISTLGGFMAATILRVSVIPVNKIAISSSALALTCAIAVPLNISYKRHSKKAIHLFNETYR